MLLLPSPSPNTQTIPELLHVSCQHLPTPHTPAQRASEIKHNLEELFLQHGNTHLSQAEVFAQEYITAKLRARKLPYSEGNSEHTKPATLGTHTMEE